MRSSRFFDRFGPGLIVSAAFIGPGTVTTASVAGAGFGFALCWAVVFSVVATIVLQEMSARLGLVTRRGLGEAVRTTVTHPALRLASVGLIVAGIAVGNAAFEMGNILGAALGMEALSGVSRRVWSLLIGVAAGVLLATGTYRRIERALVLLVVLMSVAFIGASVINPPSLRDLFAQATRPGIPQGSLLTIIALVGTTVVPYNLFLHASAVREKWPATLPLAAALQQSRVDTLAAVSLGGLVTLAIMTTAATAFFSAGVKIENAGDMAVQLEPLLGPAAKQFFALGLIAAGLTSAITAPLAAAYATSGALGWDERGAGNAERGAGNEEPGAGNAERGAGNGECGATGSECHAPRSALAGRARFVWAVVLAVGTLLACIETRPVAAILFAQAANGILLPAIALFLFAVMNRRSLLGEYANGPVANVLGAFVLLTVAVLGGYQILRVFGLL